MPTTTQEPIEALETESQPESKGVLELEELGAEPTREEIAELAYSYWISRNGGEGSAEDDWLRAEAELRDGRG